MKEFFAQGDIILERVSDISPSEPMNIDPDGSVVLARGEVTGHRHRFMGGVTMFRANEGDGGMPSELYLGHIKIAAPSAELVHEEHATIVLEKGTYRIRRQREYDAGEARLVAD